MKDEFQELALKNLAGRASDEESGKLYVFMAQNPDFLQEYEKLELKVNATEHLLPLVREPDFDDEEIAEQKIGFLELLRWFAGLGAATAILIFLLMPFKQTEQPLNDLAKAGTPEIKLPEESAFKSAFIRQDCQNLNLKSELLSDKLIEIREPLKSKGYLPTDDEDSLIESYNKKREQLGKIEKYDKTLEELQMDFELISMRLEEVYNYRSNQLDILRDTGNSL